MVSARLFTVCGVMLCALLAGCSDPYAQFNDVKGTVTLEGKPLDQGDIQFLPLENQGTQSGASIKNGAYEMPKQNGLKPGKYLVQITSGDGKTPANEDEAGAPGGSTNIVSFDRIPEDWNVNSKKEIEIKANAKNTFNFDIPKAATPKKR